MLNLNVKRCANCKPTKQEHFREVSYLANVCYSSWKFPFLIVQSENSLNIYEYLRALTMAGDLRDVMLRSNVGNEDHQCTPYDVINQHF